MAWRFKASKYKNAAPIVPKLEVCVRDICVGSYQTYGNNIAASAAFMAFNWDHAGSSLAVLPIDDCGRKSKTMPLLHAHSDTVTDLDFSPFHDGILATGSQDCLVKIWNIPQEGLQESMCTPECIFSHKQRRVESVGFHPTVGCMLHSASFTTLAIWDVAAQQEMFSNADHSDVIQSVSWKRDGSLMSTSCKDKMVRVIDPRSMKPLTLAASSHQSIKDSRVVWLGDQTKILTTGFDSSRLRQIIIRDIRKFCEPEKTLELDCSTGILMPLFDPDTRMLFLCGKGDSTILYMETIDNEPYLIEGIRHSGEQTKGACLAPKRALRVMEGEVNRVLQLTSSAVIPIMYQVPRKSYRDYHGDLFPDTPGPVSINTPDKWKAGSNLPVPLISLNPKNRVDGDHPILVQNGTFEDLCKKNVSSISTLQSDDKNILTSVVPNSDLATSNIESKIDINPVRDLVIDVEMSNPEEKLNITKLDGIEVCVEIRNGSPPKPLPRASRTGSLSESNDEIPKPVARPRTSTTPSQTRTITAFKPRLGPKPFSTVNRSEEFSFDKVFSVPNVPGNDTNGDFVHITENSDTNRSQHHDLSESPASDVEDVPTRFSAGEGEYNNSKYDTSSQEEETNSDSLNKASTPPSTTERRKLFEIQSNSKEDDDSIDKLESFERSSLQRSSIAERRRLYENRSQSVQEPTSIEKSGSPVPFKRRDSLKNRKDEKDIDQEKRQYARQQSHEPHLLQKVTEPVVQVTPPKRTSTVFGRVSKFRHLKGTAGHKSTHIENVRNISRQISGECDGFQANPERVAVPLSGAGGKLAVFELSRTGKVPDGVIPALVHGSNIMDFQWDPFNHQRLAVACDDGIIRLWSIPETGLSEPTNIPETELNAHSDKIYFIKFHPTAQDVLATGSHDMSIKIWDLNMLVCNIILKGHIEQMFSFAWSPCGQFCATVSKDSKIRVYYPRSKDLPIHEGPGPVGSRGARIVWALEGRYLVVMGFDKVSERQIMIFSCTNLSTPLSTVSLDVSPAILIPFYDEDSSTLFLTGKGDTTIYVFEVTDEAPYLCALSHHRCSSIHQGLSFLPKNTCDVASVEFAKALRLTNNAIEPLSFTVPRIKNDLFQDDLFPPTRVTWKPIMSASQWFCGTNKSPKRYSLQPEGMDCLSSSQGSTEIVKKSPSIIKNNAMNDLSGNAWTHFTVQSAQKKKQDEIQKSVSNRLPLNLKLEQDDMEGVDEKEWEE